MRSSPSPLAFPGGCTGETDPRGGKGFDARRTGPAYAATAGAGEEERGESPPCPRLAHENQYQDGCPVYPSLRASSIARIASIWLTDS